MSGVLAGILTLFAATSLQAEPAKQRAFEVTVEASFMTRSSSDDTGVVFVGPAAGNPTTTLASSNDLHGGVQPGVRALISGPLSEELRWEAGFHYLSPHRERTSVNAAPNNLEFFTTFIPNEFDDATDATVAYESRMLGFEANVAAPLMTYITGVVGARFIEVREELDITYLDQGFVLDDFGTYLIDTRNRLFGIQAGARAAIPLANSWTLNLRALGGPFANFAEQNQVVRDTIRAAPLRDSSGKSLKPALMADGGVGLTYRVSSMVSISVGYQAMYIYGLALAPEQIVKTSVAGGLGPVTDVDGGGAVLWQGGVFRTTVNF